MLAPDTDVVTRLISQPRILLRSWQAAEFFVFSLMACSKSQSSNGATDSSASLGFEAKLWLAAGKLRDNMDTVRQSRNQTTLAAKRHKRLKRAFDFGRTSHRSIPKKSTQDATTLKVGNGAEYKHVVLGLIFLKYISDAFEQHHTRLMEGWHFGVPPKGDANFAWVQHFSHHFAPAAPGSSGGMAGFVLANRSMSSNQSGDCPRRAHSTIRSTNSQSLGRQRDIRKALIEADLVDRMVALPGRLFYSTQIPVCLWFLAKSKAAKDRRAHRRETLFIDARKMGTLIDRVHRELTDADLQKIVSNYHAWRGIAGVGGYADIAGFCKSATTAEIAAHGHILTPGRYVGVEEVESDGNPFEEKMPRLVAELHTQFDESVKLEQAIKANLRSVTWLQ